PPGTDEPLDTTGVLVRADSADHRKREVTTVGLDPHGAGSEGHPVNVAAFPFEPRKADPFPGTLACTGSLPVPIGVHRSSDAVGVGLLRTFLPPHRTSLSVDTHLVFN